MNNFNLLFVLNILLILASPSDTNGQERFKAGLLFGFNVSQLDGDLSQGFDKWGLHFGARGVAILSPRVELSTEILFSQRGSRFGRAGRRTSIKNQKIQFNYMEVPILINFLVDPRGEKKNIYFKTHLSTGFSIGRMISSSIEEVGGDQIIFSEAEEFFNKNDFSILFGLTHYVYKNVGLGLRMTISTNKIFDAQETPLANPDNELNLLRSYFLSGRVLYMF